MKKIAVNWAMTFDVSSLLTGKEPCFKKTISKKSKEYRIDNHTAGDLCYLTVIGNFNPDTEEQRREFFFASDASLKVIGSGNFSTLDVPFAKWLEVNFAPLITSDREITEILCRHLDSSSCNLDPDSIDDLEIENIMNIGDNEIVFSGSPKLYLWRTFIAYQDFDKKFSPTTDPVLVESEMSETADTPIEDWEYSLLIGVEED
jgi:hypothetical protein